MNHIFSISKLLFNILLLSINNKNDLSLINLTSILDNFNSLHCFTKD